MLTSLYIDNFVLIDRLALDFPAGLTALTGETGAGKSILLDALGLVLGARAEGELVRTGADKASVTAEFELADHHPVFSKLNAQEIEAENPLILRRVVNANGRSKAFINDQPVAVGLLKSLRDDLVEIHGQFETQGLLNPATHRRLLDDYGAVYDARAEVETCWQDWARARADYDRARQEAEQSRAEEDYVRTSLADLDALEPEAGEAEALDQQKQRLKNREQVLEGLNEAYMALGDDNGAQDHLNRATGALARIADKGDDSINSLVEALDSAIAEIQRVESEIASMSADLSNEDRDLESVDERLHDLRQQARKHDCACDDLPEKRDELARRLEQISHQDETLNALSHKCDAARQAYIEAADNLHTARRQTAEKLDRLVAQELPPLKLEKARFVTQIDKQTDEASWGPSGMDKVAFLIATNPGSEPAPLNKIASGGELARFMLALKVIIAETGTAPTLIFDEVDSGIGGATADAVGQRLARLAAAKQLLVVTHSPQVASRANQHWIVSKQGNDTQVTTTVTPLHDKPTRREEIARMLAGANITSEARAAADRLLEGGDNAAV